MSETKGRDMRNRRRRSFAVALVGTAAAGIMIVSATTATAGAWTQTTEFFDSKGSCQYWGQQDVNNGVALAYDCRYEYFGPDWVWHLYEFVE